ncbi:phosphoribosyltransferase [Candidatus Woesearchaeota archaeon]|nr:phosphoribosyltransferase [Candidatus Woesearchaeota archaeon]
MLFKDRHDAGKQLAEKLKQLRNKKDVVVLGIPRGGVEVAFSIAKMLKVPLSIVVTKKIGHPNEPEFAIGAASLDNYIIDENYSREAGEDYISHSIKEISREIRRRYKKYTKGKIPQLKNKIVVIVDDGLATGYTMLAAVKYVKSKKPKKVIVAVPVAAQESFEKVREISDEVVCLGVPAFFSSVGSFYRNFAQLEDGEVIFYLEEAKKYIQSPH